MHRARDREDEGRGLCVSSWFTLLSVHPLPGRRENGSRQGTDVHFHSCICNKTTVCSFANHFTPLCPNHPLTSHINLNYTVKARAHFIACILCSLSASGMIGYEASKHHLWHSTQETELFLSQKHQQRLKICQNKGHSSLPSKWTNYGRTTLHPPILQRWTRGTRFSFCWLLHKASFSQRWLHTNCCANKQCLPSDIYKHQNAYSWQSHISSAIPDGDWWDADFVLRQLPPTKIVYAGLNKKHVPSAVKFIRLLETY